MLAGELPGTMPRSVWDQWCDIAREQNQYVPPERVTSAAPSTSNVSGDRPGDDFNRRATWEQVLAPHGWRVDRSGDSVTYWTRPGKQGGASATTGHCKSDCGGDLLYVFSSNAVPFEPDRAYSKFSAYAVLEHKGDFVAAAKALKDQGYGKEDPTVVMGDGPPKIITEEVIVDGVVIQQQRMADDGILADPDFATNEDLKRLDLGTRWVWERWLQMGTVNLLAAEGGMGKTRFVADLCRRIVKGLPMPDGAAPVKFDGEYIAMWCAGDRNQAELLTLSESFGFGDKICYSGSKAEPLGGVTLNTPDDFLLVRKRLKAARPLFFVVDTAGGATGYNLAKQEEARAFFSPLLDIAVRYDICVIVITHLNASKNVLGKRAEERVRTVMRMSAENREPETPRRLEVVKSNSLFPPALGMLLKEYGSEYDNQAPPGPESHGEDPETDPDDSEIPLALQPCVEWICDKLADGPKRVHDLRRQGEASGYSSKTIYKVKALLKLRENEDSEGYKTWASP